MHYDGGARCCECGGQGGGVEDVGAYVVDVGGVGGVAEGRGVDVEDGDGEAGGGVEELRDDVCAEEAAAACYEDVGGGHEGMVMGEELGR